MIKKLFLVMISFVLISAQAQAATGLSLKQAFDEFNYSTTVEWDQKDKAFYQNAVEKLKSEVVTAQAKGMTNGHILDEISNQTNNEKLKAELQSLRLKVELGLLSANEIQEQVQLAMANSYQQGASWNGEVVILAVVGVLVVAFMVGYISCLSDPNHTTVCSDYTYCDSYYGCETGASCGCSH